MPVNVIGIVSGMYEGCFCWFVSEFHMTVINLPSEPVFEDLTTSTVLAEHL